MRLWERDLGLAGTQHAAMQGFVLRILIVGPGRVLFSLCNDQARPMPNLS